MSRQNNQDHPGLPGNIGQRLRNVPLRERLPNGRDRLSDAWWRAANSRPGMAVRNRAYVIRHFGSGRTMTNVRNTPAVRQAAARTPFVRNRIDRATGHQWRNIPDRRVRVARQPDARTRGRFR